MSHPHPGPLASYNSLTDKHLMGYFNNTRIRRHLQKAGLITRSGRIISDKEYRINIMKKEHQRFVRECLAQAIFHKVLDMERHHEIEIKKKLESFAKKERVQRIRVERSRRCNEDVIPLLPPRPPTGPRSAHASSSAPETEHSDSSGPPSSTRPNTAPGKMQRPHRLQPLVSNISSVRTFPSSRPRDPIHEPDLKSNREIIMQVATAEFPTGVSPYRLPVINNYVTPVPPPPRTNDKPLKETSSATTRGRRFRPTTAPNGFLFTPAKESTKFHRMSAHSNVTITMVYYGKSLHLSHDEMDYKDEVKVYQQHCGGENLCVYSGRLLEGDKFQFTSRRHYGFPFSLTFFQNGIQVDRLSSCCEYKHRKGSRLGGKHGHFGFVSVDGASPCYRCIIAMGLDKKPAPPPKRMKEEEVDNEGETNRIENDEASNEEPEIETEEEISKHESVLLASSQKDTKEDEMDIEEGEKTQAENEEVAEDKDYDEDFEADEETSDRQVSEEQKIRNHAAQSPPFSDENYYASNESEFEKPSHKERGQTDNEKDERASGDSGSEFNEEESDKADAKKSSSLTSSRSTLYSRSSSSEESENGKKVDSFKEEEEVEEARMSSAEPHSGMENPVDVTVCEELPSNDTETEEQGLTGESVAKKQDHQEVYSAEENMNAHSDNESEAVVEELEEITGEYQPEQQTVKENQPIDSTGGVEAKQKSPEQHREISLHQTLQEDIEETESCKLSVKGEKVESPEVTEINGECDSVLKKIANAIRSEEQCSSEPEPSDTSTEEEDDKESLEECKTTEAIDANGQYEIEEDIIPDMSTAQVKAPECETAEEMEVQPLAEASASQAEIMLESIVSQNEGTEMGRETKEAELETEANKEIYEKDDETLLTYVEGNPETGEECNTFDEKATKDEMEFITYNTENEKESEAEKTEAQEMQVVEKAEAITADSEGKLDIALAQVGSDVQQAETIGETVGEEVTSLEKSEEQASRDLEFKAALLEGEMEMDGEANITLSEGESLPEDKTSLEEGSQIKEMNVEEVAEEVEVDTEATNEIIETTAEKQDIHLTATGRSTLENDEAQNECSGGEQEQDLTNTSIPEALLADKAQAEENTEGEVSLGTGKNQIEENDAGNTLLEISEEAQLKLGNDEASVEEESKAEVNKEKLQNEVEELQTERDTVSEYSKTENEPEVQEIPDDGKVEIMVEEGAESEEVKTEMEANAQENVSTEGNMQHLDMEENKKTEAEDIKLQIREEEEEQVKEVAEAENNITEGEAKPEALLTEIDVAHLQSMDTMETCGAHAEDGTGAEKAVTEMKVEVQEVSAEVNKMEEISESKETVSEEIPVFGEGETVDVPVEETKAMEVNEGVEAEIYKEVVGGECVAETVQTDQETEAQVMPFEAEVDKENEQSVAELVTEAVTDESELEKEKVDSEEINEVGIEIEREQIPVKTEVAMLDAVTEDTSVETESAKGEADGLVAEGESEPEKGSSTKEDVCESEPASTLAEDKAVPQEIIEIGGMAKEIEAERDVEVLETQIENHTEASEEIVETEGVVKEMEADSEVEALDTQNENHTEASEEIIETGGVVKGMEAEGDEGDVEALDTQNENHTEASELIVEIGGMAKEMEADQEIEALDAQNENHTEASEEIVEAGTGGGIKDMEAEGDEGEVEELDTQNENHTEASEEIVEIGAMVKEMEADGEVEVLDAQNEKHTEASEEIVETGGVVKEMEAEGAVETLETQNENHTEAPEVPAEGGTLVEEDQVAIEPETDKMVESAGTETVEGLTIQELEVQGESKEEAETVGEKAEEETQENDEGGIPDKNQTEVQETQEKTGAELAAQKQFMSEETQNDEDIVTEEMPASAEAVPENESLKENELSKGNDIQANESVTVHLHTEGLEEDKGEGALSEGKETLGEKNTEVFVVSNGVKIEKVYGQAEVECQEEEVLAIETACVEENEAAEQATVQADVETGFEQAQTNAETKADATIATDETEVEAIPVKGETEAEEAESEPVGKVEEMEVAVKAETEEALVILEAKSYSAPGGDQALICPVDEESMRDEQQTDGESKTENEQVEGTVEAQEDEANVALVDGVGEGHTECTDNAKEEQSEIKSETNQAPNEEETEVGDLTPEEKTEISILGPEEEGGIEEATVAELGESERQPDEGESEAKNAQITENTEGVETVSDGEMITQEIQTEVADEINETASVEQNEQKSNIEEATEVESIPTEGATEVGGESEGTILDGSWSEGLNKMAEMEDAASANLTDAHVVSETLVESKSSERNELPEPSASSEILKSEASNKV
ncbi:glutamate-rich protein 3 isoform X2 [Protopterus annectens]|uniref:glutamate-rich protein 3 isoform X2 n=1 Tax=Protopterus annectens TaxID=7888 RepID=UPI001CFAD96E|nr:glutamate-rich protein 3 isoform X2 [Protopterus annectens]